MTNATRVGLAMAGGALAAWLAMAGPPPGAGDGARDAGEAGTARLAQTAPPVWTRASCLPEGEVAHVEAYLEGRGQGFVWARYADAEDGGAGEVVVIPVGTAPIERDPSPDAHIERRYAQIVASNLADLRGFWAVARNPTGLPLAWLGARAWDGTRWWVPARPDLPEGATERLADRAVSDRTGETAWVPFEATYGCPPSAPGCRQVGVKAFHLDPRVGVTETGTVLLPAVAPGAARYGVPDVHLVSRLDDGAAWVVGHGEVYVLPFVPQRQRPIPLPVLDAAAGVSGYATAAVRDAKGRLLVALWTEARTRSGLVHGATIHALDGTQWAAQSIDLAASPLFERGAAYERATGLAVDPNGTSLWVTSHGGGVLEVDATVFARPQWLEFADRAKLGLAEGERIVDLAVAGTGESRLVVLGTTGGIIASRDLCGAAPTPTETPRTTGPTTPAARETETATPTEARATATATPPVRVSPTPTATRETPPLRPIYLPVAVGRGTLTGEEPEPPPTPVRLDVVWLVDRSASMLERFGSGRQSALAVVAAVLGERAKALPAGDQAAVVAFDEPTEVLAPLTADKGLLVGATEALTGASPADGSRLDLGLVVARRELSGPTRRPAARPAVVVLSDGSATRAPTADEVARAADPLRREGVAIWAVALGPGADAAWLAAAAGEARVLRAGDAIELDAALGRIERSLRAP